MPRCVRPESPPGAFQIVVKQKDLRFAMARLMRIHFEQQNARALEPRSSECRFASVLTNRFAPTRSKSRCQLRTHKRPAQSESSRHSHAAAARLSLSTGIGSTRAACSAGAIPKSKPVSTVQQESGRQHAGIQLWMKRNRLVRDESAIGKRPNPPKPGLESPAAAPERRVAACFRSPVAESRAPSRPDARPDRHFPPSRAVRAREQQIRDIRARNGQIRPTIASRR